MLLYSSLKGRVSSRCLVGLCYLRSPVAVPRGKGVPRSDNARSAPIRFSEQPIKPPQAVLLVVLTTLLIVVHDDHDAFDDMRT